MMRRIAAAVLVAAALLGGGATTALASISSSQLLSIEGQFMCVSCHEPLNQVYSAEAQAEKQTLIQLFAQGRSMSQVKTAMVADYGKGVLAKPSNPVVYVVPIVLVLGAVAFLFWALPRWRRRSRSGPGDPPTAVAAGLSAADEARLNTELDAF
jgi:cytochrome c-type biogenesis protein CcmH/NrfF